jgi:hypothetical protein
MHKKRYAKKVIQILNRQNLIAILLRGYDEICSGEFNDLDIFVGHDLDLVCEAFRHELSSDFIVSFEPGFMYTKALLRDKKTNKIALDVDLFQSVHRYWWPLCKVSRMDGFKQKIDDITVCCLSETKEFQITLSKEILTYRRLRLKQQNRLRQIYYSLSQKNKMLVRNELGTSEIFLNTILCGRKLNFIEASCFIFNLPMFSLRLLPRWLKYKINRRT